jgi:23S rRNA (pseudouridine1915-N3)-methyltransferase
MKILVVLPIKASKDPLLAVGLDYLKRCRSPFSIEPVFVPPKHALDEDQKLIRMDQEGALLLKKTEGYVRVALTEGGKLVSSQQFTRELEKSLHNTPKMAFIIGGAFGLSPEVLKVCHSTLSLSPMTMPHRMAFLVLSEQLYRAGEIINGTLYHK